MAESKPKCRWYDITPDRLIIGLLAVESFLFLSERFQWCAFDEKKGWTVLIAMAAVCLVIVLILLWLIFSSVGGFNSVSGHLWCWSWPLPYLAVGLP